MFTTYIFFIYVVDTNVSVSFNGCQSEVDEDWHIFWPPTPVGSAVTQKCGGNDSLG